MDVQQADKTSADYYFDSYAHFGIHEEMIKDHVRTNTYRQAILNNRFLFKDKVVMDVGCGTGILSLFAAKAGARHVYGMECSAIAEQAKAIVAGSEFADRITIVQGKVEEVELPNYDGKVDIIISEWMGYFLLYESMLDTVLFARDKWLAPDGLLFPDRASLYITAIEDADYRKEKLEFWDDVYGFDMSVIKQLAIQEPLVDVVEQEQVATDQCQLRTIDLRTARAEELNFEAQFSLRARRNDHIHALVTYFDVAFTSSHKQPCGFSTSPFRRSTHWKQTVLYLQDTVDICQDERLEGTLAVQRNAKNPRDLDIRLHYHFAGKYMHCDRKQAYRMR